MFALEPRNDLYRDKCSGLDGFQELYNDFDAWITKFNKFIHRSTQFEEMEKYTKHIVIHEEIFNKENENSNKTKLSVGLLPLQELYVQGLLINKQTIRKLKDCTVNNSNIILNTLENGSNFVCHDFDLFQRNRNVIIIKYIRSKL